MNRIFIDDRERSVKIHDFITMWNEHLELNAEIIIQRLPIADLLYETDKKPGISGTFKIIDERKSISDLLSSIYDRRLNNEFKNMLNFSADRKIWSIEVDSSLLTLPNQKAISTLKAEATALGIFTIESRNSSMLAHNFIQQCLNCGGHRVIEVSTMVNRTSNLDSDFLRRLKQYPGIGDEGAIRIANQFDDESDLFEAPCHPDVFIEDVLPRLPFKISEVLRRGKEFKKTPKYPLLVAVNMVESFYGSKYNDFIKELKKTTWGVKD